MGRKQETQTKIRASNKDLRSGGAFGIVHSFQNRLQAKHGGFQFGHALLHRAKRLIEMVSVSPRVESIQHFAAGEVGEITGALTFRSGFQHLVFVLAQAKYYQAVSSVTEHSSSSQERTGPDARRSQRLKDAVEIRHWAFLGAAKPSSTVTPRCAALANRSADGDAR